MNKENKTLNLALRVCLIVTWLMSNISFFVLMTGFKNIKTEGLDKDNVGERMLKVIGDFADKTTLYYVTLGMLAACLVLAVITRYKTRLVSYIFKIIALGYSLIAMISGLDYISALGSCKGLSNLTVEGTSTDAVAAALSAAGMTDNVENVAKTLTSKDDASLALAGYIFPIIVLFILVITSIHCLVKKNDPNIKTDMLSE